MGKAPLAHLTPGGPSACPDPLTSDPFEAWNLRPKLIRCAGMVRWSLLCFVETMELGSWLNRFKQLGGWLDKLLVGPVFTRTIECLRIIRMF